MKTITDYIPLLFTRIAEAQTAREARAARVQWCILRAITIAWLAVYALLITLSIALGCRLAL